MIVKSKSVRFIACEHLASSSSPTLWKITKMERLGRSYSRDPYGPGTSGPPRSDFRCMIPVGVRPTPVCFGPHKDQTLGKVQGFLGS
jgi:hypothetical protein